jgi:hypothetical protein
MLAVDMTTVLMEENDEKLSYVSQAFSSHLFSLMHVVNEQVVFTEDQKLVHVHVLQCAEKPLIH